MVLHNDLPTCSVQRRHAMAERARVLGLPPSDSVLRRHYEQLLGAQRPAAAEAGVASAARRRAAPASAGGGLMGWLRRLFGG
jgi:hypothetical protein